MTPYTKIIKVARQIFEGFLA